MRGPPLHEEAGGKWVSDEEEVREGFVEMEDDTASGISLTLGGGGAICFVPIMEDWLPPSLPDTAVLLLLLVLLL